MGEGRILFRTLMYQLYRERAVVRLRMENIELDAKDLELEGQ